MRPILLLEDDPSITSSLLLSLPPEGFAVTAVTSVKEARARLADTKFEALLIDVTLPDGNGIDLCREIRTNDPSIAIIVITARSDEATAVRALEWGANDYVRKPFGTGELVARLRNVTGGRTRLEYRAIVVDSSNRTASFRGEPIPLRRREFDILRVLIRNAERIVSRQRLLDELGDDGELSERTIDSHVSRLRRNLGDAGVQSIAIVSLYGQGYRLEPR